ncbi:hypothetical protein RIF29_15955 [Crotalaria pallida]|uniref:MADS-box domain-containing protein n=1 Tax=Crotalaria pallida TaxID=3830 RepID=A0AAN9IJG6_CROPI
MGRVKLKIKRLENTNGRQATYSKRKNGILKKASELSILCDIDIILLMFSPSGKPSLCSGRRSNFEEVITKFAHMTPHERAKRKLESLEALRKTFKRLNHDINLQELLGTSHWTDPGKINNVEKLEQMENSLKDSLNQIRSRKENMQKQQLASMQWNSQFNEMHNPFRMITEQHLSPLSWIANGDSQNMVLPEDPKFLLPKDIEGTASCSFGSYASYLGSSTKTDISNSAQENGVLSDLSSTAPVRLQLNGHFPYQPYNFSLLNDMKLQPAAEMNTHENHQVDYHVNERFEAPRPANDSDTHEWNNSTPGPCAVTMFDEYLFGQASFPQAHFGFS